MTLDKFVHLIATGGLYFARVSSFNDPWDGMSLIDPERAQILQAEALANPYHTITQLGLEFSAALKKNKKLAYASCWHSNRHESEAMWSLYKADLCIRTTYAKLCDKLPSRVLLGQVSYIDPSENSERIYDPILPFFRKRKSFEHEREVRGVLWNGGGTTSFQNEIRLDLKIIDEVVTSPYQQPWTLEVVRSLLETYRHSLPVRPSNLMTEPWI
jgi:hypothetical protein